MKKSYRGWGFYISLIVVVVLVWFLLDGQHLNQDDYNYAQFEQELADDEIKSVEVQPNRVYPTGRLDIVKTDKSEETLYVLDVSEAQSLMDKEKFTSYVVNDIPAENWLMNLLPLLLVFGAMFILFMIVMNNQAAGGGGGSKMMNFGKSRAKMTTDENRNVTFENVAGLREEKEELEEIARICKKVPYEKAETFYEAIQSTWFIQLILQIESNGHSLSYGRFDQYIYPYYKRDKDLHNITEEQAIELLDNLWIKTLTINKVRSQAHTFSSAGSPMYQNVTIGGQTPDKKDATNELSYLVLKSVAQTRLPQPNLTVRYHKNMPKAFLDEAIEVMKLGTGMPAFNNDEIIIPSFIEKGVKEEDAYNYSAIGCVETAVPGKWGYRCTGMSYMNFPRILLMAMNDGVDMTSGKRFFEGSGYSD